MNINEYQSIHENKSHFQSNLPYNTYPCSIPLDFKSVPLHWHDEAEFIYIKKGQGILSIDLKEELVCEGDIALVLPGSVHGIYQFKDSLMEYENIIFDMKMFSNSQDDTYETYLKPLANHQVGLPHIFRNKVPGYESVRRYLDRNDGISQNRTGAYGLAIKGNLMLLLFDLVTLYEKTVDSNLSGKIDRLKPVIKYVENHYDERISISMMAELSGFSESHFMRFFKETFSESFVTYLNDYRLSMAARMLLQSDETILNISEQVGFENLSHFNRSFKKKYLKTPREYRM